jgi:hypothetical protein
VRRARLHARLAWLRVRPLWLHIQLCICICCADVHVRRLRLRAHLAWLRVRPVWLHIRFLYLSEPCCMCASWGCMHAWLGLCVRPVWLHTQLLHLHLLCWAACALWQHARLAWLCVRAVGCPGKFPSLPEYLFVRFRVLADLHKNMSGKFPRFTRVYFCALWGSLGSFSSICTIIDAKFVCTSMLYSCSVLFRSFDFCWPVVVASCFYPHSWYACVQ